MRIKLSTGPTTQRISIFNVYEADSVPALKYLFTVLKVTPLCSVIAQVLTVEANRTRNRRRWQQLLNVDNALDEHNYRKIK